MAGEFVTTQIEGLDKLLEQLKQLPAELVSVRGGPVRKALARAAFMVRDEARNLAPVRTGLLKEQIAAIRNRNPREHNANEEYGVGVRAGSRKRYSNTRRNRRKQRVGGEYSAPSVAFYWRFLEFGTEKMSARPFLRPAFDQTRERALETFKLKLSEEIAKIVARIGGLP